MARKPAVTKEAQEDPRMDPPPEDRTLKHIIASSIAGVQMRADQFCKANGLDTVEKKQLFIRQKMKALLCR